MISLDEYVADADISRLDLIKADIEGAELLFLRGAMEALHRFKPMLILEIQAHSTRLFGHEPTAVFDLLSKIGYRAFYVEADATLKPYAPGLSGHLPDYNFVFRHEDHRA